MKTIKIVIYCLVISVVQNVFSDKGPCTPIVAVEGKKAEKMALLIGIVGDHDSLLIQFIQRIEQNLSCQQQTKNGFSLRVREFEKIPSKNEVHGLQHEGFELAVFINAKSRAQIEARIYSTAQALMIKGLRYEHEYTTVLAADDFSRMLWKELVNQESSYGSVIAYCKDVGAHERDIFVAYPFGAETKKWVESPAIKFAPRWHPQLTHPTLFYSECTPINVRLMSADQGGASKIVSNLNGLNMVPSFANKGNKVVLCATRNGSMQLYIGEKSSNRPWQFNLILQNQGNNISPVLCENGDVILCSDFETKKPHIYYYHADTRQLEKVTEGMCPSYSEITKKIAFSRVVEGTMQIFLYDCQRKQIEQITSDAGDKQECSWSPCGNYLVFSVEHGKKSRIAVKNLVTKEQYFITAQHERCSYPCWSPGPVALS